MNVLEDFSEASDPAPDTPGWQGAAAEHAAQFAREAFPPAAGAGDGEGGEGGEGEGGAPACVLCGQARALGLHPDQAAGLFWPINEAVLAAGRLFVGPDRAREAAVVRRLRGYVGAPHNERVLTLEGRGAGLDVAQPEYEAPSPREPLREYPVMWALD